MVRLNMKNNSQTALAENIGPSVTSFIVDDASLLPDAPFRVSANNEIMQVNKVTGNTLQEVTRGIEDTTEQTHTKGTMLRVRFTAGIYDSLASQEELMAHKEDYASHLNSDMPHQFKDLKNNKIYQFGFQVSADGEPQLIYEEVL